MVFVLSCKSFYIYKIINMYRSSNCETICGIKDSPNFRPPNGQTCTRVCGRSLTSSDLNRVCSRKGTEKECPKGYSCCGGKKCIKTGTVCNNTSTPRPPTTTPPKPPTTTPPKPPTTTPPKPPTTTPPKPNPPPTPELPQNNPPIPPKLPGEKYTWPSSNAKYWTDYVGHNPFGSIDVQTGWDTPVLSMADGTVKSTCNSCPPRSAGIQDQCSCAPSRGCGNFVIVLHDNDGGKASTYCHLRVPSVKTGDRVKAGQLIGYSGSSGMSSGPHLHVHFNDKTDVRQLFPGRTRTSYRDFNEPVYHD